MHTTLTAAERNPVEILALIDIHLFKIPKRYKNENEEIRLDIFVAVLEQAQSYDPTRSAWPTFLDRTIRMLVRSFLLKKRWQKNLSPESLEEIELRQIPLVNEHPFGELGIHEKSVFADEIQEVVRLMPVELADCCRRLMHYTLEETAEILNIPKSTLHHRLKRIERILIQNNITPNFF